MDEYHQFIGNKLMILVHIGYHYLLKVMVANMDEYHQFVAYKLAALDNIGNAQSAFVMKEIMESTALPLHK